MDKEIWKDVLGYGDLYEVSSYGNIKGKKSGRILKATLTKLGYLQVNLCRASKFKSFLIHRLVMKAFYGDYSGKERLFVVHKDGDNTNNMLSNLELCSAESLVTKSRGFNVVCEFGDDVMVFPSQAACARHFGVVPSYVNQVLDGAASNLRGWTVKRIPKKYFVQN